jgi:hypothetical protein
MSLCKKLTKSKDYAMKLLLSWLKKHRRMCVKQLSHDNELSQDIPYSTKKPIFYTSVDEINVQELNCINMGCAVHFTDACNSAVNHVSSKMRNSVKKQ